MKNINLNEKDIFKLFNEIKIDENEFNKIDEDITDIQKKRIKKTLRKKIKSQNRFKILKYGSAAAAIILILLIGIGTASPAFAENIPVLGSIIQRLNDKMGTNTNYTKYSKIINKKVTDKGISITLNEIIADDSKILIGYTIKSDKNVKDLEVFGLGRFLKINGAQNSSSGTSSGSYIDDYTYIGSEELNTSIPKNCDKFNIDLNITEVGKVHGKWKFAFTASKKEVCKESTVFKPNTKVDLEDSIVNIDKVVFSPIDTYISLSGIFKNKCKKPANDIWKYDYWIAYNDKGIELIPKSLGGGSFNNKNFNTHMNYKNSKYIPKYLTIAPVNIIPSSVEYVSSDGKPLLIKTKKPKEISRPINETLPIELPQGKMGKLIIEKINTDKNKTTINFKAIGKASYFQAQELYIKDNNEKNIEYKKRSLKRSEKNPNKFTVSFEPLNSNKKYNIYTNDFSNIEFREDLKFKIKLNQ
ncbi:DUF4179 domain-containing protein [Clostridium oceanicum]|uniref:DUF4179 domain-containing protein n=1 Tax=Clostridium oceanicum TaxID=1543 RepID=A0ABN1J941_9CLOT